MAVGLSGVRKGDLEFYVLMGQFAYGRNLALLFIDTINRYTVMYP